MLFKRFKGIQKPPSNGFYGSKEKSDYFGSRPRARIGNIKAELTGGYRKNIRGKFNPGPKKLPELYFSVSGPIMGRTGFSQTQSQARKAIKPSYFWEKRPPLAAGLPS
ncbi:MAG: hypothetical protein LBE01_04835 [Deltaproteobacteria bacterium]|jgi:hypothetical protein|nr:hypothetical protein [Deltaproteobacteria bacterium]